MNQAISGAGNSDVPSTDLSYWLLLIGCCSFGETAADLLSHELKLGYLVSSSILLVVFLTAMVSELRRMGPRELRYWFAIAATATVGTTLADLTSRTLKLGYAWSSALMIGLFAAVFLTWHRGRSESLGSQFHYWAAILVASVMGTTLGDFLSNDSGLGFGKSAAILGGLLLVVLFLRTKIQTAQSLTYWTAIILTSTFGAASGDYLAKEDGVGLGAIKATIYLGIGLIVILGVVAALRRKSTA